METEIWKDVVGYEGIYDVSDKGRVRSLSRLNSIGRKLKGRILKQNPDGSGHLCVALHNGKQKTRKVHQLVCEAFIGPRPEGKEVCHGPNGQLDNSTSNLCYGTHRENQRDMIRDGTHTVVPVIRGDGRKFISQSEAALTIGCRPQQISKCCSGKRKTVGGFTWRYADGPIKSKGGTRT